MPEPESINEIKLCRATVSDATCLAEMSAATFSETFGHLYPPEDLQAYLANACSVTRCRAKLDQTHTAVWFAELDSQPIGFVVAAPCKLPAPNLEANAGEVQQLYVYARYHNRRIGTRLLDTALVWLTAEAYAPLYVGVWSENDGARRLYGRYGFTKVGEYDFPVGNTIDREWILKR